MVLSLSGARPARIAVGSGRSADFPSMRSTKYGLAEDTQSIVFAGLKAERVTTQVHLARASSV
jgi:hypothetical protein